APQAAVPRSPDRRARSYRGRPGFGSLRRFGFRRLGRALRLLRLLRFGNALHRDQPTTFEAVNAGSVTAEIGEGDEPLAARVGADLDAVGIARDTHQLAFGHRERDAAR